MFDLIYSVVGGLLSAHLLSVQAGMPVDEGWPCSGPLLDLAKNVARKLLPGLLFLLSFSLVKIMLICSF